MNNITLFFIGTGYNNNSQVYVKIYDLNNTLIYEGQTFNGKLTVCLKYLHYYIIYAKANNEILNGVIYIKYNKEKYIFILNRSYIKNTTTTFLLTDYYYSNLPIEKGEIILWEKK